MNPSLLHLNTAAHDTGVEFSSYSGKSHNSVFCISFVYCDSFRIEPWIVWLLSCMLTLSRFIYCYLFYFIHLSSRIINKPLRRLRCRYSTARIMGYLFESRLVPRCSSASVYCFLRDTVYCECKSAIRINSECLIIIPLLLSSERSLYGGLGDCLVRSGEPRQQSGLTCAPVKTRDVN
jgi:hypothetical protein